MTQQPPSAPYQPQPPQHPQATAVLVLGLLGLLLCQILGPIAWVMGNRAIKEIDANPGYYGGRSEVNTGRILGIVGTVLLGLGLAFALFYVVVMILIFGTAIATSS